MAKRLPLSRKEIAKIERLCERQAALGAKVSPPSWELVRRLVLTLQSYEEIENTVLLDTYKRSQEYKELMKEVDDGGIPELS